MYIRRPLVLALTFFPLILGCGDSSQSETGSAATCEPSCRSGYTCVDGTCVSACNPPCADGEKCVDNDCVPDQPETPRIDYLDSETPEEFTLLTKWPSNSITYFLNNFPSSASSSDAAIAVNTAFESWHDQCPTLSFNQVFSANEANIVISWFKKSHGDQWPFDGPGHILAHAMPPGPSPANGDVHFDDEETWTMTPSTGTISLPAVALHEIGHALGLGHSLDQNSIMWQFYQPNVLTIGEDDRNGLANLYGCAPNAACGDGNVTAGEACDGNNLAGQTCQTLGFGGGTLTCKGNCDFDTTGCCPADLLACSGGCKDVKVDPSNCGACGTTCLAGQLCMNGSCTCPAGSSACGNTCKQLSNDPANCGQCGHTCAANQVCSSGTCTLNCGALANCGGTCANLQSDHDHCGSCVTACAADQICSNGVCDCAVKNACGKCGPTPVESCNNKDDDCDGSTDEGLGMTTCGIGACKTTVQNCQNGVLHTCIPLASSAETCNGIDDDCDGLVDEDPACITCVDLQDVALFPLTKVGAGDKEFNSHGPDVDLTVSISRTASTITAQTCVTMTETVSDWTEGTLCSTQTINISNTAITSDTFFRTRYLDTDHDWDNAISESYSLNVSDVVTAAECIGDTTGDDICATAPPACSTCNVHLGCVNIRHAP